LKIIGHGIPDNNFVSSCISIRIIKRLDFCPKAFLFLSDILPKNDPTLENQKDFIN